MKNESKAVKLHRELKGKYEIKPEVSNKDLCPFIHTQVAELV